MKKWMYLSLVASVAVLLIAGSGVKAGPLDPPGAPAPTSVTLNQLGSQLDRIEGSRVQPAEYPNATDSSMAGSVLLRVEGAVSGLIAGGVVSSGAEGAINVLSFSHGVEIERDAASGLPTGKRQHKPLTVTKPVDKSTPLLMAACVTSEVLTECTLQFFREGEGGKRENYYTIELENARIVSVKSEGAHYEEVAFVYQRITWTYADGSITAEDDWTTPTGK